jgi:hypothetical protein
MPWSNPTTPGAACGETERGHRPFEVRGLIGLLQRRQLTQRRLVDLDHGDACGLEIGDLVAQRKSDLVRRVCEGLFLAHERPGEDRHPAVLGHREAVEVLGEVLHHVVALRLPV